MPNYGTVESQQVPSTEFSLQDEAHETSRRCRTPWDQGDRLRLQPVRFISSGLAQPVKVLENSWQAPDCRPDNELASSGSGNVLNRVFTADGDNYGGLNESSDCDEDILIFQGRRQTMDAGWSPIVFDLDSHARSIGISTEDGGAKTAQTDEKDTSDEPNNTNMEHCLDCSSVRKVSGDDVGSKSESGSDGISDDGSDDEAIKDYVANIREAVEVGHDLIIGNIYHSLDEDDNYLDELNVSTWHGDILDGLDTCSTAPARRTAGRSKQMRFEDQEFNSLITSALQKDRKKKGAKKRERQLLRIQGQLGSDPTDLSTGHHVEISVDQMTQVIREFLAGYEHSIILPPMNASNRKIIHELAHKFNLKSKSVGKGLTRRPTLIRTRRTIRVTSPEFDATTSALFRRHLMRPEVRRSKWDSRHTKHQVPMDAQGAKLMDGQVVGASLPELGSANRGRAMLEKMGWSSGTRLGATENKGILQPVTQVMKKGKSGLGINH
jgi:hypothetical protein